MKIILDAMGGDHAPLAPVMGAIEAAKLYGAQIILVGRGEEILGILRNQGIDTLLLQALPLQIFLHQTTQATQIPLLTSRIPKLRFLPQRARFV